MSFFSTRLLALIAILPPVLAGCQSYTRPLGLANSSITDAKQGEDCRVLVFGVGGLPDLTGSQAMRSGEMTKLRSTEYRVNAFSGFGSACLIAHGE